VDHPINSERGSLRIIGNAHIVTCDPAGRTWERGDIVVDGDRIAAIGPRAADAFLADMPGLEFFDAARFVVVPGLINAHAHSNEAFEQGAFEGAPLEVWLAQCYPPLRSVRVTERLHYLRTMLCCLQSIRSGVTTIQDDLMNPSGDPSVLEAAVTGYRDAGIRASIAVTFADRGYLDGLPWLRDMLEPELRSILDALPSRSLTEQIASFECARQTWHGAANGRIRLLLGPRGPQRCTPALLEAMADLSARHTIPVHMHVLETKTQAVTAQLHHGRTMIEVLSQHGLLTPRMTINHAIWLTETDITLLGEAGCSATHNPLSNMKLGSGIAPLRRLSEAGVNVALGTDGASTGDTFDQIEALRAASLLHKLAEPDPARWIGAEDALRMSTINGARSSMRETETGSLEIGKKADLVLLDRRNPGFIPLNDPVRQLAFSATSEAVDTVIVGGRTLLASRKFVAFNEADLLDEIAEAAERYRRDVRRSMDAASPFLLPALKTIVRRAMATPIRETVNPRLAEQCAPR